MKATVLFFWSQEMWPRPGRRTPDGFWGTLRPDVQAELERKAQICADLFQRSSSCVEGRNGQLSLKRHALHRFTLRKLQSLTVQHNCLVRQPDGTTAAERFYGTASRDLFGWLLDRPSSRPPPNRLTSRIRAASNRPNAARRNYPAPLASRRAKSITFASQY